jgi:hypothetical protein
MLFALLLSASFMLAQAEQQLGTRETSGERGQITIRGCVSKSGGDYVLIKENPAVTYEIQGQKLGLYLGKHVEVTGTESPSLSTSEDALTRTGSPSPETITVKSIKTISEECVSR